MKKQFEGKKLKLDKKTLLSLQNETMTSASLFCKCCINVSEMETSSSDE